MALARELKKRNVNLRRYMELKADQEKFEKYVQSILADKDRKALKKKFNLPEDLHDINTSPPKLPKLERVNEELEKLNAEFSEYVLSDYIDIYRNSHAMVKTIYYFQKYLDPNLKKQIFKWVENFNLVNRVKDEITEKVKEAS